jgi:HEAT repeat protein
MSAVPDPRPTQEPALARARMPLRNRILFLAMAWVIVLMPFLFWRGTWFGRPLSDQQIGNYLHDSTHARHTQHALVQIGERISRHDATVNNWYPDLVALASSPVEEIRSTDAWVMGQDPAQPAFHRALLGLLKDSSPTVRGNAALALVRFGDPAAHDEIVRLLQPTIVAAPAAGQVTDTARAGTSVHQRGTIAKLKTAQGILEVRTPIAGRVHSVAVQTGANVTAGSEIATVDPATEQIWEALRALYLIGRVEDLPLVQQYERDTAERPQRISRQAALTAQAIRDRARTP